MNLFRRYFLPGFIFLAVVIGGGYSTGRELIEFFFPAGPWGGVLGMLVTMAIWSAVCAVSFELARVTGAYDYKTFFTVLLGRGWIAFEIAYFALLLLVLAVIGAAAGAVAGESFGWPPLAGTLTMMAAIGALLFFGSGLIEKVLAFWAVLLYAVYVVIIFWSFAAFGDRIAASFAGTPVGAGWFMAGVTYAGYNLATVPAVLFSLRHLRTRREALTAGLLAGPVAMLPGVLFYVAMMGRYPEIGSQAVPSNYLLGELHAPWFHAVFQVVFFGVLIKTGTALLHAINERVAKVYELRGRAMPRSLRSGIALAALALAVFAATSFGLVALIARGYGALTWVFIAVLVVPVLTVGAWKIRSTIP
jgi:uncharacterized membrane protein YkvI